MNAVSIISVCFGGVSLIVSFILFIRTLNRDSKETMEAQANRNDKINASLLELNLMTKNINTTTNDIKADIKALNFNMNEVEKRVSVIENEQKTMWMRIDEVKEKIEA